MADCKDYLRIQALMTLLRTITTANNYETQVNSVFIPKKILKFSTYPSIAVYYNDNNMDDEGYLKEQSTLDVTIVYVDGKDDENETDSYIVRLRNVAADIRKCIMSNVGLGGLVEYIQIVQSMPGIFVDENELIEANITTLKIQRSQNMYNPYE